MTVVSFTIPGTPVGKGRPRFARRGAFVSTYNPEKTASYENLVKIAAQDAMGNYPLFEQAVSVEISLFVKPPTSWSLKKHAKAFAGITLPTTKPDIDNVVKGIFDACNNIVWNDDKQVCELRIIKRYAEKSYAFVVVRHLELVPMKECYASANPDINN